MEPLIIFLAWVEPVELKAKGLREVKFLQLGPQDPELKSKTLFFVLHNPAAHLYSSSQCVQGQRNGSMADLSYVDNQKRCQSAFFMK